MDPAPESLPDDVAALKGALIAERARGLEVAAERLDSDGQDDHRGADRDRLSSWLTLRSLSGSSTRSALIVRILILSKSSLLNLL
jgi:hypothetical protein